MNLVNKEYKQFEEKISNLVGKMLEKLGGRAVIKTEEPEKISQFPVIPQLTLSFDINRYEYCINAIIFPYKRTAE